VRGAERPDGGDPARAPFVITLGTMWIVRGLAFVISRAESIVVPAP
jgi:ribose/xylose/arabinose/galactoside ABC-type transport system permease subunit